MFYQLWLLSKLFIFIVLVWYVYIGVCGKQVDVGCHLVLPSTLFVKIDFFFNESAGLGGQQAPGILLSLLFYCWISDVLI